MEAPQVSNPPTEPTLHNIKEWDAIGLLRRDITIQYRRRPTTTRIILHDSHTSPAMDRGVDYLLVNGRTQGLLTIGFNFVIERNGETVECRPFDRVGSHCAGFNHNSVGVCLVGGREQVFGTQPVPAPPLIPEDNFTGQQLEALRSLVHRLWLLYPDIPVVAHSEVHKRCPTPCPCVDMGEIRASLRRGVPAC